MIQCFGVQRAAGCTQIKSRNRRVQKQKNGTHRVKDLFQSRVTSLLQPDLRLQIKQKYSYHVEIGDTAANGPENRARLHGFHLEQRKKDGSRDEPPRSRVSDLVAGSQVGMEDTPHEFSLVWSVQRRVRTVFNWCLWSRHPPPTTTTLFVKTKVTQCDTS